MQNQIKYSCSVIFITLLALESYAQNEVDVLRYSLSDPIGSVRTIGMGGAYGALGADLASLGINPAGIGMYRRGDIGGSVGIQSGKTSANLGLFYSSSASSSASRIGTFGVSMTVPSVNPDWPFVTIAVAHQKRSVWNNVMKIDGADLNSSLLGVFQGNAEGTHNDNLNDGSAYAYTASLAWYAYLLDPNGSSNTSYITPFDTDTSIVFSRSIEHGGDMSENQISIGGTYQDWLSLGGTLASTDITFTEKSAHTETPQEQGTDLDSWSYSEDLYIEGTGINIRLGAIAKISNWLRVGIAWQSPTRLELIDSYSTSISSDWKDGTVYNENSPVGGYEYLIITPSRTTLSSSFLMGKLAVISADLEIVDYSKGTLKANSDSWLSDGYDFASENEIVEELYTQSYKTRVGLEMRVAEDWRVRFGGSFETSPYSSIEILTSNPTRLSASFGGEYRSGDYYMGFAWKKSWTESDLFLINPDDQDSPIVQEKSLGMVMIGGGMRF